MVWNDLKDVRLDGENLYVVEAQSKWSALKSFYAHRPDRDLLGLKVEYVSYQLTSDASSNISAKEKLRVQIASDPEAFDNDFRIAAPLPGIIRVNPKDAKLYDVAKRAWSPYPVQTLTQTSVGSHIVASSLDGSFLFTGTLALTSPSAAGSSYAAFFREVLVDPKFRHTAIQVVRSSPKMHAT